MARPINNNTFKIIEPVMEAVTSAKSPARRENIAMKSSTALPKVAFINAEIVEETRLAMILVDSAIKCANPISAAAIVRKENSGPTFKK